MLKLFLHITHREHFYLAPGDQVLIVSNPQFVHNLGKVHWRCVDDRGKQTEQLVQVWWCPVQQDVTMWCSVKNLRNQLLLLCHYAWQGWGTAVASEQHSPGCLCVKSAPLCASSPARPVRLMHPSGRHVSLFACSFFLFLRSFFCQDQDVKNCMASWATCDMWGIT